MTRSDELRKALSAHVDDEDDLRDATGRLAASLDEAEARWPGISIDPAGFAELVASRVDAGESLGQALSHLHTVDLCLAFACVRGSPVATRVLAQEFAADIDGVHRHAADATLGRDDLRQRVFDHLLLRDDGRPPRIGQYGGRGRLRYWIRIVAARILADATRGSAARESATEANLDVLPAEGDPPEAAYLRHYYREQFESALRAALEGLEARDRDLLRYAVVDQMPTSAIAAVLGVHRGTAARWLKEARQKLLWRARDTLVQDFAVPRGELDSVMRLVRSQLALSVGRLLEKKSPQSG